MSEPHFLTAEEAAARLDISRATLYAYVSRGLIRSQPAPEDSRRHHYLAADIELLLQRKEGRRDPAAVAENVLDWGMPVLESSITLIDQGRFYYRGQGALTLALEARFGNVAGLIWRGDVTENPLEGVVVDSPAGSQQVGSGVVEHFQALLLQAAGQDVAAYDLRAPSVIRCGARIVTHLTHALTGQSGSGKGIAANLQQGWGLAGQAQQVLNAALILCADHELNVSAFTARCIASAGATPYAVVIGGLAALGGTKHGGYTARVEALMDEVRQPQEAYRVLAGRLRRGESLPGFGHPLYADGDPRAALLLPLLQKYWHDSPALELAVAMKEAVKELLGVRPNIDFGLVTLARVLELPPGSALALFALGRTVGWIGHALEQYDLDSLIRPRARYVGRRPER